MKYAETPIAFDPKGGSAHMLGGKHLGENMSRLDHGFVIEYARGERRRDDLVPGSVTFKHRPRDWRKDTENWVKGGFRFWAEQLQLDPNNRDALKNTAYYMRLLEKLENANRT